MSHCVNETFSSNRKKMIVRPRETIYHGKTLVVEDPSLKEVIT